MAQVAHHHCSLQPYKLLATDSVICGVQSPVPSTLFRANVRIYAAVRQYRMPPRRETEYSLDLYKTATRALRSPLQIGLTFQTLPQSCDRARGLELSLCCCPDRPEICCGLLISWIELKHSTKLIRQPASGIAFANLFKYFARVYRKELGTG